MLNIIICEDDAVQLNFLKMATKKFLFEHTNFAATLLMSTTNPTDLQSYIQNNHDEQVLYILDIEFANSLVKGFDLAKAAQSNQPSSDFIFITSHDELAPLTLQIALSPVAYITKNEGPAVVRQKLFSALNKIMVANHANSNQFTYTVGSHKFQLPISNIQFFKVETGSHKVSIFAKNTITQINDNLSNLEDQLPTFFRNHKSYLTNLDQIEKVSDNHSEIILKSGYRLPLARRRRTELKQLLNERM